MVPAETVTEPPVTVTEGIPEESEEATVEETTPLTGWQEVDGKLFYFDEDGSLYTGWLDRDEYRYYLTEDGAATGPYEMDGRTYFFTPKGICVLLVNDRHLTPADYELDLVPYKGNMWIARSIEEPFLQMLKDCEETGVRCTVNCGFRDVVSQARLAESEENKPFPSAARPGQSEHQTGLAVDIVCSSEDGWLQEHCWEYGFIVRYPDGKQGITHVANEFWHYRYVGREVAMDMRDTGLCLEEYLGAA